MKDDGDITEGFSRSLSLYWDWRTQRLFSAKARGARSSASGAALAEGEPQQQQQHEPHARGRFQDDSQALLCEHWLEMADTKHRYGSHLLPYYDHWRRQKDEEEEGKAAAAAEAAAAAAAAGPSPSSASPRPPPKHAAAGELFLSEAERDETARRFFEWLDGTPEGLALDLGESAAPDKADANAAAAAAAPAGPSRAKLERDRVRYLTEEERAALEVMVDASTGRLIYRQSGALVHTRGRREGEEAGGGGGGGGEDSPRKAGADEQGHNGTDGEAAPGGAKIKPCKWIWVLDRRGPRLYVHAKRRGKFHHSSFLEGAPALSAGGLEADEGVVLRLTADSGHYKPSLDNFMSTVSLLRDWGADLSGAVLSAKHLPAPPMPAALSARGPAATAAAAATATATAAAILEAAVTAPMPAAARLQLLGATSAFANSVILESAVEAALAAERAARKKSGGAL